MNKTCLVLLVFTGVMALAQTSNNTAGASRTGQNSQSGQTAGSNFPVSPQTLRGCLKQAGESWSLSQSGEVTPLTGDRSMLNPHDGHEVEVQGMQAVGGPLQVTSVITIANSCLGQNKPKY